MADIDYNWQIGKSLSKRMKYMLKHELMCDVTFLLGPDKSPIRAHKYMLASASPVFYSMFEGPMAEKGDVWIPDIELGTFKLLLDHVYKGDDLDVLTIPRFHMYNLMYAADKYMLDGLKNECIETIGFEIDENFEDDDSLSILYTIDDDKTGLSVYDGNYQYFSTEYLVFQYLQGAIDFNVEFIVDKCVKYICENGTECLRMDDFEKLPENIVSRILKSNILQCKEELVYEAMVDWAKNLCKLKGMKCTGKNIRKTLGSFLYLIRFPLMEKGYFNKYVCRSGILTKTEISQIRNHLNNNIMTGSFLVNPRKPFAVYNCEVDEKAVKTLNQNGAEDDNVDLHVDCDVKLSGVYLFPPKRKSETCKFKLSVTTISNLSEHFETEEGNLVYQEGKPMYFFEFSEKVEIHTDQICNIELSIEEGTQFLTGKNYKSQVTTNGVVVKFTKPDTNEVYRGQIAGVEICNI